MEFNINKYDNIKFSDKDLTHKRIKALLLWFEYEVYKKKAPLEKQIQMMDDYLVKLMKEELYEVLPFFKNLREEMLKRLEDGETDIIAVVEPEIVVEVENVSVKSTTEPFLTTIKHKIITWFKSLF